MRENKNNELRSRVYLDRPAYADFEAPAKFQAIETVIARHLLEHPNTVCSYSGGSDSDIMLDLIERVRKMYNLPPIHYIFINTGLEMEAIKRHVKETAEKYGIEIETIRPKRNIVLAVRDNGLPFLSKIVSERLGGALRKKIPISIVDEYDAADDPIAKYEELKQRYPHCVQEISFLCSCGYKGERYNKGTQFMICSAKYLKEFIQECPPTFPISAKCCDICKKAPLHKAQAGYDMVITGERAAEGGIRKDAQFSNGTGCFAEQKNGVFRMRPLFYVTDKDKAWYKEHYNIRYSDAYEVYGLKRTGCTGCPINAHFNDELERIRPYEPNLVKAAWNVFGDSYRYRQRYNEYRAKRNAEEKERKRAEREAAKQKEEHTT